MRILLDNGIRSHSEFAQNAIKQTSARWGDTDQVLVLPVHGFVRKAPAKDVDYERQKEALFTLGRLIRKGRIEAYDYVEILFERVRGRARTRVFDALQGCNIQQCHPALQRSRFMQTNFRDTVSKGGKKDRKAGREPGKINQIAFLEWLCSLRKKDIDILIRDVA